MSENKPKYHDYFHKFMIYFALWAFALLAFIYCWRNISSAMENGHHGMELALCIIINALTGILGILLIKTRFDLAAYRAAAVRELPGACIAGAVLCLANYWWLSCAGEEGEAKLLYTAGIFVIWGIVLYRYYKERAYLFTN